MTTVMNLHFRKTSKVSGLAEELLAYQERLCSMVGWLVSWFVNRPRRFEHAWN